MEAGVAKLPPIRTKLPENNHNTAEIATMKQLHTGHEQDVVDRDNDIAVAHDIAEPLTPAGRVFLDPSLSIHILVIMGSKIPINMEAFKTGINDTLLKHKRFSSTVRKDAKGNRHWVPTSVNLDDHIQIAGADDEDPTSSSFVEDYVAKLAQAPPLDVAKPLFEIHILKAKLGDAVENVVLRVHHALGDGTSLMSLLLACSRQAGQPDSLPTFPSKAHSVRKKRTVYEAFFLLLWRFLLVLWYTIMDICSFMATTLWLEDSQTPLKGYAGIEKKRRKIAYKTVSLDDIRIVKQAIHGTVNDVLFGMIAAGLSRYLQQQYSDKLEQTPKPSNSKDSSCNHKIGPDIIKTQLAYLRVRACVLFNTRPAPGLHELDVMMHGGSQSRWGNQVGYVLLPVPVRVCENPLEYAYEAKSINDKKKLSLGAKFSYRSGAMLMNLTGPELPTRCTYNCTSHTTLAFSNVFGPLEEIQLFGHPITHILPTVAGQPQALCVHIQSYMGKVALIVSSAKDVIPDPEILCKHMVCALEEMKQKAFEGKKL